MTLLTIPRDTFLLWTKFTALLRAGWLENKPLLLTGIFSLGLLLMTSIGLLTDTRTLVGEPIWLKPTKFALSSIFYSLTLLWLLSFVDGWRGWIRLISWVTAVAMSVELILISLQALRGVRSHFNVATPFDAAVFSIMGTMILFLWLVSLIAVILLIRQRFSDPSWGLTLRLGLAIGVIGSALGFLMTMPSPGQVAASDGAGTLLEVGAHSVGVPDGGEGLPLVGWSTTGGDLRIGHFVGMHAMQVLPLLGIAILRLNAHLDRRRQRGLIWVAGLGYLGVVFNVTWQALRAEPLLSPGPLTLLTWGILFLSVTGASVWTLLREPESAQVKLRVHANN